MRFAGDDKMFELYLQNKTEGSKPINEAKSIQSLYEGSMADDNYKVTVVMPYDKPVPSQITSIYGEPGDYFPDKVRGICEYEWYHMGYKVADIIVKMAQRYGAKSAVLSVPKSYKDTPEV